MTPSLSEPMNDAGDHRMLVNMIETTINIFVTRLADSPISLTQLINRQIGFYTGYCYAAKWELDVNQMSAWENKIPRT